MLATPVETEETLAEWPLLGCERCQEPRRHQWELLGAFPVCQWWAPVCGECGRASEEEGEWRDVPVQWATGSGDENEPEPE